MFPYVKLSAKIYLTRLSNDTVVVAVDISFLIDYALLILVNVRTYLFQLYNLMNINTNNTYI